MLRKALIICWRGLAEVWHQKKLMVFLVSYPLLFMLIFGSAFGGEGSAITVDVAMVMPSNGSSDAIMDSFIDIFENMDGINLKMYSDTGDPRDVQSEQLIQDDDVVLVIFMPEGFMNVNSTQTRLDIYYDVAADQSELSIGMSITSGIIEEFSSAIFQQSLEASVYQEGRFTEEDLELIEILSSPLEADYNAITPSGERELKYIDYLVPGLVAMSMLWTGVSGASTSLVEDRVKGIRKRILSTPTSRGSIILGDMLSQLIIVCLQIFILLLVAKFMYGLNIIGSYWLTALVILIGSLSMIGIGILIANFSKTAEEASQIGLLVNFPMMFLAGIFFPLSAGWMQNISKVFPLTYVNDALRGVMVRGYGISEVRTELAISIVFALLVLGLGIIMLNRSEAV
ncbi:MAG TPA: ABC transporter permease [Candidatus Methanofastidiosa archaeon]|nr:ABC transporter permease [Candidatus Methanofastidiosa archaeon]